MLSSEVGVSLVGMPGVGLITAARTLVVTTMQALVIGAVAVTVALTVAVIVAVLAIVTAVVDELLVLASTSSAAGARGTDVVSVTPRWSRAAFRGHHEVGPLFQGVTRTEDITEGISSLHKPLKRFQC